MAAAFYCVHDLDLWFRNNLSDKDRNGKWYQGIALESLNKMKQ